MQCVDAAPFIARRADAPETLDATILRAVDSHVAGCAACRDAPRRTACRRRDVADAAGK